CTHTTVLIPYTTLFRSSARHRRRVRRDRRHLLRLLAPHHLLRAGERVRVRDVRGLRPAAPAADPARHLLRPRRLGPPHREHLRRSEEHTSELQSPDHLV